MLNKCAVYHKPYGNWAYYLDNNTVRLVIRTKKNNVKKIVVEYYDKYENVPHSKKLMQKLGHDQFFDYFYADIVPPHKRLCYFFIISCGGLYFYKQYGFSDSVYDGDFQMPYINPCDVYTVPNWINKAVFYQIFPDSFNKLNNHLEIPQNFYGGNLKGIIDKIPYLKNLGINAIYLNPICKSNTAHRYNVIDYYEIDPLLGTKTDFKKLVDLCHKNGIKVVLDAVLNHSSNEHEFFKDVMANGKKSKYASWYVINKYKNNNPVSYDRFAFENYMPKWNTSNKETLEYLTNILVYWIKEFDVDGFRFDVGNEIGHRFIRHCRNIIKEIKPDAYLLGEIWHDAHSFLLGNEYDGVTNFSLRELMFKYYTNKFSVKTFVDKCNQYYYGLPKQALNASSNFLCNHDTTRVATEFDNLEILKNMIATQFVLIGTPLIYYGEEIPMKQTISGDQGARQPMQWDKTESSELLPYYKKLIKLKTSNNCLINGEQYLYVYKKLLIISRKSENEKVYLILNNTENDVKLKLKSNAYDYLNDVKLLKSDKIVLKGFDRVILIFN